MQEIKPTAQELVNTIISKPSIDKLGDKNKNLVQKPIRTYEGDIADLLSKNTTSITSIAIAESVKKEKVESLSNSDEEKNKYLKKIIMGLVSLLLVALGISAGFYLYEKSPLSTPAPQQNTPKIQSIVNPDKQVSLFVDSISKEKIINEIYNEIKKNSVGENKIIELILGEKNGESISRITGSSFIKKTGISIPDILLRSLTDRWMLGSYTENSGQKTPFIIFTTDFFQNAFSGMLVWEKSMPEDLSLLLNFKDKVKEEQETASSSISSFFNLRGNFIDKEIKNRDVREFVTSKNNMLFLYSFIYRDTLVLTTTESALLEIISRIEKQTYVR